MPELPNTLADREYQKFVQDANGNPAVRIAPGAVTDTDGNELEINEDGQASMTDERATATLACILEELKAIKFQLKLITGA